jgi:hypothetical protein
VQILPKTLFARLVLVLLVPMILMQVAASYVFIARNNREITKLAISDNLSLIQNQNLLQVPVVSCPDDAVKRIALPSGIKCVYKNGGYLHFVGENTTYVSPHPLPRSRISLVILWNFVASFILFAIAYLFLRNQVNAIISLKEMLVNTGRGINETAKFKGSSEIREAQIAVVEMQQRLAKLAELYNSEQK